MAFIGLPLMAEEDWARRPATTRPLIERCDLIAV